MPDEILPPHMLAINLILHPHVIMSVSVSYGAINNGEINNVVFTLFAQSLSVTLYCSPLLRLRRISSPANAECKPLRVEAGQRGQ